MIPESDPTIHALALMDDIPTLPELALRVSEILDEANASLDQVTDVLRGDPVLTVKLLRLVNSAYYAVPGGVATVEKALSFLGYNTIFRMFVSVSVVKFSRFAGPSGVEARDLWRHSLGVALASETIGERIGFEDTGELFTAGLLHDIGKMALAAVDFNRFDAAVTYAMKHRVGLVEAERAQGLPPHDVVGGVLAKQWRLPTRLTTVIEFHHKYADNSDLTLPNDQRPVLDVVVLADALCRQRGIGHPGDPLVPVPDGGELARLGLDSSDLSRIANTMAEKAALSPFLDTFLGVPAAGSGR